MRLTPKAVDQRIPYGLVCTWWDSIDQVGSREGLPVCPHCRNVLLEVDSLERWMASARRYEADGHPGYVAFLTWQRGKCFPNFDAAKAAYTAETGLSVP